MVCLLWSMVYLSRKGFLQKLWFMVRLLKQTGKITEMRNECSEPSRLNTWNSGIFNQIMKIQHYSHHILQMKRKNKRNTENCTLTKIYTQVSTAIVIHGPN